MTPNLFAFSLLSSIVLDGHATPVHRSPLVTRASEERPFATQIWVPVIVVVVLLIAFGVWGWSNSNIRNLVVPTRVTLAPQGPRELTAAELAGTINGTASGNGEGGANPAARTRRTRRPRRTPSQMSVTSLPAYNKEPGEQELVIFRGTDMEDVEVPLAHVAQDDDSESRHTRDMSLGSSVSHSSPIETLLEEEEPSEENPRPSPSRRNSRRISSHHNMPHSTEESQGLMHHASDSTGNASATSDDRGEAPPYFEVVDASHQVQPAAATPNDADNDTPNHSTPHSLPTPAGAGIDGLPSSNERRSGIRTFFNRMQHVGAPRGLGHARGPSDTSSVSFAEGPSSSASRSRHRQTPSTGSSFFRTLSRQRSQSPTQSSSSIRLNSPSLISLNSISHPLTHTLTRTEFTYPKSGLTPEQLKIISSRESIARFGVPYGPDAVAFASSSRLDLTSPPPDFEAVVGGTNANASSASLYMTGTSSAAGASRVSLHTRGDSNGLARIPSPLAALSPAVHREALAGTVASSSLDTPMLPSAPAVPHPLQDAATSGPIDPKDIPLPYPDETIASRATTYQSTMSQSGATDEFGTRLSRTVPTPADTAFSNGSGRVSEASTTSGSETANSRLSYATAKDSIATRGTRRSVVYSPSEDDDDDQEVREHDKRPEHGRAGTDATVVATTVASGLSVTG